MGAAQGGAVGGVGGGKVGAVLEGGEADAAAAGHCCEGFQAGGASFEDKCSTDEKALIWRGSVGRVERWCVGGCLQSTPSPHYFNHHQPQHNYNQLLKPCKFTLQSHTCSLLHPPLYLRGVDITWPGFKRSDT